jgi:hypothetical protein
VHERLIDPKLTFFREANFNLSGHVNSQNNRYCSSENPQALIQLILYDQNIAYGVRLAQTVSLDRYFMRELLMLNDTLMKYCIHFSLIWHLQNKDSFILCKMARLHTRLRKLSEHYAVCLEKYMDGIELLARVCSPLDPLI